MLLLLRSSFSPIELRMGTPGSDTSKVRLSERFESGLLKLTLVNKLKNLCPKLDSKAGTTSASIRCSPKRDPVRRSTHESSRANRLHLQTPFDRVCRGTERMFWQLYLGALRE